MRKWTLWGWCRYCGCLCFHLKAKNQFNFFPISNCEVPGLVVGDLLDSLPHQPCVVALLHLLVCCFGLPDLPAALHHALSLHLNVLFDSLSKNWTSGHPWLLIRVHTDIFINNDNNTRFSLCHRLQKCPSLFYQSSPAAGGRQLLAKLK